MNTATPIILNGHPCWAIIRDGHETLAPIENTEIFHSLQLAAIELGEIAIMIKQGGKPGALHT